ncbi:MAG: polyprenyl synthetase family protein [Bacteroidota bacterium]
MSEALKSIQAPIAQELVYFDKYFKSAMKSDVALLDRVMRYLIKTKGKQMRPMMVLFSANLCGGITPSTYRGAALVELFHTASLIHDDVVDDSDRRRGFFSLNALWKNKISVLVGDFLLTRGMLMSLEHNDIRLLKIFSQAVKQITEGELLQMEKARKLNIDEAVYLKIISHKTASLFACCCETGAVSATDNEEWIKNMREFGLKVGIAYQIKDDLFDYGTDDVGKPLAIDIKERKMTLPLIHVLNKASWKERRKLINIVRNHNTDKKKVSYVINYVKENNGIAYSEEIMHQYVEEARALLNTFEDTPARQSLHELINYAIMRKK